MEEVITTKDFEVVGAGEEDLLNRRDFLHCLGKWSKIVIGATVFGGALLNADREAEAGVIHQHIEAPFALGDFIDDRFDGCVTGDVQRQHLKRRW